MENKTNRFSNEELATPPQDHIVKTDNEFIAFAAAALREYLEVEQNLQPKDRLYTTIRTAADTSLLSKLNINLCLDWLAIEHPDLYEKCLEVSFDRALRAYCFNLGTKRTDTNFPTTFTYVLNHPLEYYVELTETWIGHAFWLMLNEGSAEVREAAKNFYE